MMRGLLIAVALLAATPALARDAVFEKDICELKAADVTDTAQCTQWAVVCYPGTTVADKSADMSNNVFAQHLAFNWAAHNCQHFDPAKAKAYFDTVNSFGK